MLLYKQISLFHRESWFSVGCLCTGPCDGQGHVVKPFKNCFLVCCGLVCGFKPYWLSKLDFLRAFFSITGLKIWSAWCSVQMLRSSGRSWVGEVAFPPDDGLTYWRVGIMAVFCLSLFYPFQCGFSLIHLMCSIHSPNIFFLCSCRLTVSAGVSEFRIFLFHHLNWKQRLLLLFPQTCIPQTYATTNVLTVFRFG